MLQLVVTRCNGNYNHRAQAAQGYYDRRKIRMRDEKILAHGIPDVESFEVLDESDSEGFGVTACSRWHAIIFLQI